jgi:hypothetical protein
MTIYQLNPIYVLISESFYYGTVKLISLIYVPKEITVYLELAGDLISLFGYVIYLEIIEFKCFNRNFNTRININERSKIESIGIGDEIIDDEDEIQSSNTKGSLILKENKTIETIQAMESFDKQKQKQATEDAKTLKDLDSKLKNL